MLFIRNLSKSYGAVTVLDDVSFVLNAGEHVGVVGSNGVGKTTLLRILVGQEVADSGTYSFAPSTEVGYLPQTTPDFYGRTLQDLILESLGNLRRLQGDPVEARTLHAQALEKAKTLFGEKGFLVFALQLELALDERDMEMLDQARADAEIAKQILHKLQHDSSTIDAQDVRGLLAQLDALQGRCAGAVDELESTWKRRKELRDTPVNQWQTAEAGLFLALCRKDANGSSSAGEVQPLLTASIRTLRASPLADPHIKRLAETVQASK